MRSRKRSSGRFFSRAFGCEVRATAGRHTSRYGRPGMRAWSCRPPRCFARVVWILLVLPCAPARSAEQRHILSLGQAVTEALRQNPSLAVKVSDVRSAEARLMEARGAEDFILDLHASRYLARGENVPDLLLDDAQLGAALTRPLPTGGRVSLRVENKSRRSQLAQEDCGLLCDSHGASAALTLSVPLLRGAGLNVARASRRRARSDLDQMTLQREAAAADLLREVVQTYWELAFGAAQVRIRQSSLELARGQLQVAQANIGVGKEPPSAAVEVEATIALREDEVLQAEQFAMERSIELQHLLGSETIVDAAQLSTSDALEPKFIERDLLLAIQAARERNPQLNVAQARIAAASIEVDVARNGLLPRLDMTMTGALYGAAGDSAAAFKQLAHPNGYLAQVGVAFSFPIERNAALGRAAAAQELLAKARREMDAISIQISAEVTRSIGAISFAQKRVEVLVQANERASLDLEAERARFRVGRSSNFEVLRRQEELARARLQHARAQADYLKAEAGFEALTGQILERFGAEPR